MLCPGPFEVVQTDGTRAPYQDAATGDQLEFEGTLSCFGQDLVATSALTAVRLLDPSGQVIAEAAGLPGILAGDVARAPNVLPMSTIATGASLATLVTLVDRTVTDLADGYFMFQ